ncbi:MAG: adenylate/guanylate cyclase domain-containing protein, partial [Proteobacteria bacterium]|nr:adenylate/guanylate cyclase domain-containing protein [Pseudomonadota bacterium]
MSSAARIRGIRLLVRIAISGLSLAIFAMHIAGKPRFEIVDRVENYLYDVRIRLTMPGTLDDRIVIVDIDEASQVELGQWPWPRDTLARIVDNLFDHYEIKVLGFDALFAEAEETSAERLIESLAASEIGSQPEVQATLAELRESLNSNIRFAESFIARDVVTGFVFKDSLSDNEPETTGTLPLPIIREAELAGVTVPFVQARGYAGTLKDLQENASAGGFFDSPLIDSDGVFRRAPLVQQYRGDLYPSLALAVTHAALGSPAVGLEFASNRADQRSGIDLESFRLGDRSIPVNEQVAVYIPFRGPQGSFPFVPAKDVFDSSAPIDSLNGKIVLLGASAAGLLDLRSTPVGQRYIGVEAHANLIAGLLDGAIRQQPSYSDGLELFLLVVIGLLTVLVLPRLAPITALAFVLGILFTSMALNLWMWTSLNLVIPVASLLGYTLIAALLQINYGFFIESRNKRHLSRIFGQYIPPSLVEEMDESGEEISLEGESRQMSVLFSDVRGFTTISESLDARELTHLMNEFLTPITRVIQNHRGTIDKYMGDAVMAFWGAPLNDEQHARHAVEAGLKMIEAVADLKGIFEKNGWPPIAVGVGVASGEMNVGNMGSEFRIAYTVMGDVVNLGSRIEGLTKQYGVNMIVSAGTKV